MTTPVSTPLALWIARIEALLRKHYGLRRRRRGDALDCLVLTILSQNTNDVNRDRAWASMKERFPTWSVALSASPAELAAAIRVAGLANTRAKTIQNALGALRERYGAITLEPLEALPNDELIVELTALPGVGIKTALCVLMFALGRDVFPVDTHIRRIAIRIGWAPPGESLEKVTRRLAPHIPPNRSYTLHLNLIRHGRQTCTARRAFCERCFLIAECEHGKKPLGR